MTKSPVSAFVGSVSDRFQAQVHVAAAAFLQASRDGYCARGSHLDRRAAETSRPDRRAAMGCSPTINAGASTA